ncbi:carbohydrate kinase [Robbsia sp. Bb-Pol-6]|uniref:Carbohydrate kinase n=1 Tax=Robbsia betulipollinis TaxID=2981849 RepID=A0ABT3ZPM0_9BURK|nr:carbohydrate kinase [Robbsia betulipollinis]MCY0388480.1 carbohydrate kinase [Robbsia betulipollinis]
MSVDRTALPRLLVFGEALTDFVRSGAQTWHSVAGGSGWNVARVGATLGVPTGWGGAVSRDVFGQEIVDKSRAAGLDMRFLQVVDKPPLIAMVHQTSPPDYFFLGTDTADLAFDARALPAGWETQCEIAHFGCISLVREPLAGQLVALARRLRQAGTRISFDANYRNLMGPDYPAFFESMVANADIVKVSDEDLARIYPDRTSAAVLEDVRRRAAHALLLFTRGADGMTLFTGDAVLEQAALRVNVADTVGAGDACIGGFLTSLLQRPAGPLAEHLHFAAATAAAACTRVGAYAPTRDDVLTLARAAAPGFLQDAV